MKKYLMFATLTALFALCACTTTRINAQTTTRNLNVPGFEAVSISGALDVSIAQGNTFSVAITAERELIERVTINVTRGRLTLSFDPARLTARQRRMLNNRMIRVHVTTPALTGIEMSGATQLSVAGNFAARNFRCRLSGASRLGYLNITAATTDIDLSGASTARIAGNLGDLTVRVSGASQVSINAAASTVRANAAGTSQIELVGSGGRITLSVSGASKVNAGSFNALTGTVSAAGASSAIVNVRDNLRISASGTSSVIYRGNPRLDQGSIARGATVRRQ